MTPSAPPSRPWLAGLAGTLVLATLTGCGSGAPAATTPSTTVAAPSTSAPPPATYTTLDELASMQPATEAYRAFIDLASMEVGIYQLPAAGTDAQEAHARDELYVVLSGAATLSVGGARQPVTAGSVVFVRAGVQHRFTGITGGLRVMVVFANTSPVASEPAWESYTEADEAATRNPARNTWDAFLKVPTMTAGLYSLPLTLGGDRPQRHSTDELNLVFAGSSGFVVDGASPHPVGPGSVFTVTAGHDHSFVNVGPDVIELIVWPAVPH